MEMVKYREYNDDVSRKAMYTPSQTIDLNPLPDDQFDSVGMKYHNDLYKLFEPVPDSGTQKYEYRQYVDYRSNEPSATTNPRDFTATFNDTHLFCHPHNAYLTCRVRLLTDTAGSTGYAASTEVALETSFLSCFRRMELWMDDKLVEKITDCGRTHLLKGLLYYNKDYIDSIAKASGYCLDVSTNVVNSGFSERQLQSNNSRLFTYMIPLRDIFGFFGSCKHVWKGSKIEIRAYPNEFDDAIIRNGLIDGKFICSAFTMHMPLVLPSEFMKGQLMKLLSEPKLVPIKFVESELFSTNTYPLAASSNTFVLRTNCTKPQKVFIFFQSEDSVSLSTRQTSQKRTFMQIPITSIKLQIGKQQLPEDSSSGVTYSLSNGTTEFNMSKPFLELLRCAKKDNVTSSLPITLAQYADLYSFYAFDFTNKLDSNEKTDNSLITILWSHGTAPATYRMFMLVEYERTLQLQVGNGQMVYYNVY